MDVAEASLDPLGPDLAELASLAPQKLAPLVEYVLQFLIDAKSIEFQEKLQEYATTLKVGASALKKSVRALILFLQRALKESWNVEALEEQCGVVGLPAEVVTACWMANETQITRSLISRVSTSTQLLDMDWSFGVTTATNECDQVKFKIGGANGAQDIFLELSLEQFYQFLAQMEKAKAYVDYIKGEI